MLSDFKPIYDCIREHWENSVRHITEDRGNLIGMPFPYTVPCPEGEEMQNYFYWDIYFINIGLIGHGLIELAKNKESSGKSIMWWKVRFALKMSTKCHRCWDGLPAFLSIVINYSSAIKRSQV